MADENLEQMSAAAADVTKRLNEMASSQKETKEALVSMMKAIGSITQAGSKSATVSKEFNESLGRLSHSTKDGIRLNYDVSRAYSSLKSSTEGLNKTMSSGSMTFKGVVGDLKMLGGGFKAAAAVAESMAGVADTIKMAAQGTMQFKDIGKAFNPLIEAIPLVGSVLSKTFNFLTETTQGTYDSLKNLSTIGYTTSNSMEKLLSNSGDAGLSLQEFESFVMKNSQALSKFEGGVTKGAERFGNIFASFVAPRSDSINSRLMRLGYTTKELTEGLSEYLDLVVATGAQNRMNNEQLRDSALRTLEEVDLFAKASGKSRTEILKGAEALAKTNPALQALANRMDPLSFARLSGNLASLGDKFSTLQKALTEGVISGTDLFSQDFAKLLIGTGGPGSALVEGFAELGERFRQTGQISLTEMYDVINRAGANIDEAIDQIEPAARAGNQQAQAALALLNDIKRFRLLTPAEIKAMDAERKERNAATEAMDKFNQSVRRVMLAFQTRFLPVLTEIMPHVGTLLTKTFDLIAPMLEVLGNWLKVSTPKIAEAFRELAFRTTLLFSKEGREGLFRSLTALLKDVFAELFDAIGLKGRANDLRRSAENDRYISDLIINEKRTQLEHEEGITARQSAVQQALNDLAANKLPTTLTEFIKSKEAGPGMQPKTQAYKDADRYSIGFGHRIEENEVKAGRIDLGNGKFVQVKGAMGELTTMTPEEANALLIRDIKKRGEDQVIARIGQDVYNQLNQNQKNALVSLVYNAGPRNGITDEMVLALQNFKPGDQTQASKIAEMISRSATTEKGTGRQLQGLITRRAQEAALFGGKQVGEIRPREVQVGDLPPQAPLSQQTTKVSDAAANWAVGILAGTKRASDVPPTLRSEVDRVLANNDLAPVGKEKFQESVEQTRKNASGPSWLRTGARTIGGLLAGGATMAMAPLSGGTSLAATGVATAAGMYLGDMAADYMGFAQGGIAYRPSIFGERGPEAAVPLPDGRSIPVTIKSSRMFASDEFDVNTKLLLTETQRTNALLTALLETNNSQYSVAKDQLREMGNTRSIL